MIKTISVIAMAFAFAGIANAATPCTVENPCGNGDPSAIMNVWGLTGAQSPRVAPGAVIVDEGGVKDICPKWYPLGCSDITKTDYYRNQMKTLARQLIANGMYTQFPQYKYWYGLVK